MQSYGLYYYRKTCTSWGGYFGTMAYLAYDVYKDDKEFKESKNKIIVLPSFKIPVKKK